MLIAVPSCHLDHHYCISCDSFGTEQNRMKNSSESTTSESTCRTYQGHAIYSDNTFLMLPIHLLISYDHRILHL
eukprot:c19676_g1_i1 orf=98-319(-)